MIPISVKFAGIKVSLINREEIKEYLIQTVYEKSRFRVLFLDEWKMFASLFDKDLRQVIMSCDIVVCSSQTVAWMARMFTGKDVPVIQPVTIFLDFMRAADEMNYSLFLFGGNRKVSAETVKRIRKSFQQSRILGSYQSHITAKEMENVLTTIRKSSPQLFFASLGDQPKWEKWLSKQNPNFQSSIVAGLGNAFSIIAGKNKMPPIWFQEKGWNGFYTFLSRPYDLYRDFRVSVLFFMTLWKKITRKI